MSAVTVKLDIKASSTGMRRVLTGALVVFVFLVHCAVGLALYRGRMIGHWWMFESDAVVFGAPFLCALVGYGYVFFASPWAQNKTAFWRLLAAVSCLLLALLSTWVYMVIALNTYGS